MSSLDGGGGNAARRRRGKAAASLARRPRRCELKPCGCKIDAVAGALSGVEPSRARGEGATLGTQGHPGSSPALPRAAASPTPPPHPGAMLKAKQCPALPFIFLVLFAKRHGAFPRRRAVCCRGGEDPSAAPTRLPPRQLGAFTVRAERGSGNAARRLERVLEPAPSSVPPSPSRPPASSRGSVLQELPR